VQELVLGVEDLEGALGPGLCYRLHACHASSNRAGPPPG
jgi:hypothetical protein